MDTHQNNNFTRLNTVLMIPEQVSHEVMGLSRELSKKYSTFFTIDSKNYHPHMTLYSPEYPAHNVNKVYKAVENIVSDKEPVTCRVLGMTEGQGYIGLDIKLTSSIKKLHEEFVSALNPLREGHIREKYLADYHMQFSDEAMENVRKYGYPSAMSRYHSHVTVTRLKNEKEARQLTSTLQWEGTTEFTATHIGVYKMGEHGTCVNLMKSFKLGV